MITKAIIVGPVDGSDNYKWWVNIPLLQGVPDSKSESKLFQLYYEQQEAKKESAEKLKSVLDKQQQMQMTVTEADINKIRDFVIQAEVCGIAGAKFNFMVGDVVIVGFLDNEMSKPIILGSFLTKQLEERITYPQIKAETFSVNTSAVLPKNTSFQMDNQVITAEQIERLFRQVGNSSFSEV